MPEGPEVARIAESLDRHLSGKHIIRIIMTNTSRYYSKGGFIGKQHLKFGLIIVKIWARAKKIIFQLKDNEGRIFYMLSFLSMEGHWLQHKTKHTALIFDVGSVWEEGGVSKYKYEKTMYYEDSRRFGTFQVFSTMEELKHAFKSIGPDLLHESITIEHYMDVIKQKKLNNKEISWFLLKQEYFSGIGNYIKSEVMYISKLNPNRIIGTLTNDEISILYKASLYVINLAYQQNGLTLSTYVDPDGNSGQYQPLVYNKKVDPYGNLITKSEFSDKRGTYWVPIVQF